MSETKELPEGWEVVKIKDIFVFKGGGTPSKADPSFWDGDIYWASVKDIKGDYLLDTVDKITQKGAENSATNIAEPGDVILITRISPGKTITTKIRSAINQDLKIVIPKYETHSDFIKYLFKSIERKCIKLSSGTTVLGLSLNNLNEIETPLPPQPEQHRIVAKIEELFSSLDKGIESLKTAQAQLKTYRQAVLKWAFEGKLTNENVKEGEFPDGWRLKTINETAVKITDGEHFRPKTQEIGIPFLSAKDVRDNGVSFDDPLFISEQTASKALQRCNPEMGDILIVSRGATVGRMCIVNTNQTFCLLGSVILIKTKKEIDSRYIAYILKSPFANQKMISVSGATAQQAIYLRDIKNIFIPIAPLPEQHRIVSEIETRLSVCDKLEESITQSLLQAEALRQSILKKAFEGKLVPQNPNEEPASALLERIRAERASGSVKKTATGAKNAQVGTNRKGKRKRT